MMLTVLIEKEKTMYVSLCPELNIASQGETVEEAKAKRKLHDISEECYGFNHYRSCSQSC